MTRFLEYFRKMRPFNTFFGLYAARETIFIKMWPLKTFEFETPDLGGHL